MSDIESPESDDYSPTCEFACHPRCTRGCLNAWLMHVGESLPMDGAVRRNRYGQLAAALTSRGHTVLRWAPTFRHIAKVHRSDSDQLYDAGPGYRIQLVHSQGYRRNVGLQRLRTYRELATRFWQLAPTHTRPDVVVTAIPSLEWAEAAVDYGRRHGVPVVVDVRDLWPDLFLNAFPQWAAPAARWLLSGYFGQCERICSRADSLVAVSHTYLDWALRRAGRGRGADDDVFPIGYEKPASGIAAHENAKRRIVAMGVDPTKTICLFAGLFEQSYDLESIVAAARSLQRSRPDLQFVLCGEGSKMRDIRRRTLELGNVMLTGWLGAEDLAAAMDLATVGLAAYSARAPQSLPNKVFEYMAWELVNVSSLKGELSRLLAAHNCGVTYHAGDADDLAARLADVTNDRRGLKSMQRRAAELWNSEYRCEAIYDRFVDRLVEVAESRNAAPAGRLVA